MLLYDYPLSEEFTSFLDATRKRIDAVIEELNSLKRALLEEGAVHSTKQIEVAARISRLEHEIASLGTGSDTGNLLVIHEPFVDNKSCDTKALRDREAEVVTAYGMLTLKRREERELSAAAVRIVAGNGFPGNTHQVYPESGLYQARDGLRADLRYIVDGNADTWFEYEAFCGLQGYRYRNTAFTDGTHWLGFNIRDLSLELEIELEDLEVVGGIVIDPFVPPSAGFRAPYLTGVILDDGRGTRQQLRGALLDRASYIACLPQQARRVLVTIKQAMPYRTWVGIPAKPLPSSVVGMRYDPLTGKTAHPEYRAGSPAGSEVPVIEEHFAEPATEVLPALRFAIGLRGISLYAHTYEESSEYVSRPYSVPEGIRSLQVDVGYIVPEALAREKLVRVSVSFDDCATWYEVAGTDADAATFGLPRKISFGGHVPDFLRDSRTLYLDGVPDTFRLRLQLSRPADLPLAEHVTPIVTEYTVTVETAGDEQWA